MSAALAADANRGRVALVTGGGTGIGRATALALAASGARVVICGRRPEPLEEARARIESAGGECMAQPTDIREPDQVRALVDAALERFGAVDVLVNNAGGQFTAPAEEITAKGMRAVHRLAVDAAWDLTREVATRSMIPGDGGLIVFGSFSPRRGIPGFAHASARAGSAGEPGTGARARMEPARDSFGLRGDREHRHGGAGRLRRRRRSRPRGARCRWAGSGGRRRSARRSRSWRPTPAPTSPARRW